MIIKEICYQNSNFFDFAPLLFSFPYPTKEEPESQKSV